MSHIFCSIVIIINSKGPTVIITFQSIPLDKNPGMRLIQVVEVCRIIIGKAVMGIVRLDLIEAMAGCPFCAGLDGGCEAALHYMGLPYSWMPPTLLIV